MQLVASLVQAAGLINGKDSKEGKIDNESSSD